MQPLGPRISTAGTSYTATQVQAQLFGRRATERWLFDRWSQDLTYLADITGKVDVSHMPPVVAHDSTAAIKRGLTMRVRADAGLTLGTDLIVPHYQIQMPDGGFVDFRLGVYRASIVEREIAPSATWLNIEGRDLSELLAMAEFSAAYSVAAGARIVPAITTIAQGYGGATPIQVRIPDAGTTLPASLTWDAGASRLKAINDLLQAMNYIPAGFDEWGVLTSMPIPDYSAAQPAIVFDSTQGQSILSAYPARPKFDPSGAFNICTVKVEDPRRTPFTVTVKNTSGSSPVSLANFPPKGVLISDSKIVDAATAAARARTELQAAARVYQSGPYYLASFPALQDLDVCRLIFQTKDEGLSQGNYLTTRWQMTCQTRAEGNTEVTWQLIAQGV